MNISAEIPQSVQGMKSRLTSNEPHSRGGVNDPINQSEVPSFDDAPKFSFFRCPVRNTRPSKVMTLPEVYELIKNGSYRKQVYALRSITDPQAFRLYKETNFDYLTLSGVFSHRSNNSLLQHSGYMVLDFDHISNVSELRETLLEDPNFDTELLFTSPSGNGLKWVVDVDLHEYTHGEMFRAIEAYLKETYDLEVDPCGKDVARACFMSYDQSVYIHPRYLNHPVSTTSHSIDHEKQ